MTQAVEQLRVQNAEAAELLETMAASTECSNVWNAIQKRVGAATELYENLRPEQRFPSGKLGSMFQAWTRPDVRFEVGDLAYVVQGALREPCFRDSATSAQRRRFNAKFSRAATSLIELLDELGGDEFTLDEFGGPLTDFARSTAHGACEILRNQKPNVIVNESAELAARIAAIDCVDHLGQMIYIMTGEVARWSKVDPLIPKPLATNARRLRLIRKLSAHFNNRYETPLRACVLAITGVFFDIDGLNEATITKLAP